MRFKVSIGYNDFLFDDASKAMDFAILASGTYMPDKYDRKKTIIIEIIDENDENEEDEDNE